MREFITQHREWTMGIVSLIIGSVLTLITTIIWDNHFND